MKVEIPDSIIIQAARECDGTKMPRDMRRALAWAVNRAAEWRGELVGNPDPAPLKAFDAQVRAARLALRMIRK